MRLTNNIIDYVVQEVAGSKAIGIVKYLKGKKNVSEFTIAEDLEKDIKEVRVLLYRLVNHNLVSSIRKKDKIKGWYIYYWTTNKEQFGISLKDIKNKKLNGLKDRLERESGSLFFSCEYKCMRLVFDQAVNFEFKCPECGFLMNQENNSEMIDNLNKKILALQK